MRHAFLLFSLIAFTCLHSLAQTPYQNLWEVRKPGQSQPSYLFGTMHISDSRVYDLPDSVLLALKSCHYVALEADFSSACYSFFDYFFGEGEHSISELERLDSKLQPKRAKPELADYLNDPEKLKQAIEKLGSRPPRDTFADKGNSMQFLDAFIFRLARDNGKEVVGLEQLQDQIDLLFGEGSGLYSAMESESDISVGDLKAIYLRGDIAEMGRMLDAGKMFSPETKKLVIDQRNRVMADGLDSLATLHPCFTAVGAAHLPGEQGILKMLQQMGYSVRPVDASAKTGLVLQAKAENYNPTWMNWRNEGSGFALDLPTEPYRLDFTDVEFPMYAGIDFAGGWIYYYMGLPVDPELTGEQRIDFARKFFDSYGKSGASAPEEVEVNGMKGVRGITKQGKQNLRVQVLVAEDVAIMTMVGVHEDVIFTEAADHLFNSVESTPKVALSARKWTTLLDPKIGFSMQVPEDFRLRFQAHEAAPDLKTSGVWSGMTTDEKYEQSFAFAYHLLPPGYEPDSVRNAFNNIVADMDMENSVVESEEDWQLDGYSGLKARFRSEENKLFEMRMLLQANKMFIFGASSPEDDPGLEVLRRKIEQFHFLPLQHKALAVSDTGLGFSARFPISPSHSESQLEISWFDLPYDSLSYTEARDPGTSCGYVVNQAHFSPYVRLDSLDQFTAIVAPLWPSPQVIRRNKIRYRDQDAWEYVTRGTDNQTLEYTRYFLHGHSFYGLRCETLPNDTAGVAEFFAGFQPDPSVPTFDWTSSKLAAILETAVSPDSMLAFEAIDALGWYSFTAQDHALALEHIRSKHSIPEIPGHHFELVDAMVARPQAATPVEMRALYHELKGKPDLQAWILSAMLMEDTLGLRSLSLELLEQAPPRGATQFYRRDIGSSLIEALMEAGDPRALFDSTVFLLQNPELQAEFVYAAQGLPYLGELEGRHLGKFRSEFQALAAEWLAHLRMDEEMPERLSEDYEFLLYILSEADPDETSFAQIRSMMDLGSPSLEEFGVLTLLDADLDVDKARMKRMLNTPGQRFELTAWLLEHGQTKGFPKKHFKKETLGMVDLEAYFKYDQEMIATQMELVHVREFMFESEPHELYVYKVGLQGEKAWITAFAGPFPKDSKPDHLYFDLTGTNMELWYPAEREMDNQARKWIEEYEEAQEEYGEYED